MLPACCFNPAYEIEACNSTIKTLTATTDEGVLTSPGFPVIYPRYLDILSLILVFYIFVNGQKGQKYPKILTLILIAIDHKSIIR